MHLPDFSLMLRYLGKISPRCPPQSSLVGGLPLSHGFLEVQLGLSLGNLSGAA